MKIWRNDVRAGRDEPHGIAIRPGTGEPLGSDGAGRGWAIVDDELLAETLAELLRNDATDRVTGTPGRRRHDEADDARRPGAVRLAGLGHRRGCCRDQREKDQHDPAW